MPLTWGTSGYRAYGESTNTRHWLDPIHLTAKQEWLCPSTRFEKETEKECPIHGCNSYSSMLFPDLS